MTNPSKTFFSCVSFFLILPMALALVGCATMLEGSRQSIRVHCPQADEVEVLVDGEALDFIDGRILLDKKRDTHFVTFRKAGYQPSTISFNREINPVWLVADLIWGPAFPVAWLVDWQTSALFRVDPRDIHVILRQKQ
jgi:hypothetical protein